MLPFSLWRNAGSGGGSCFRPEMAPQRLEKIESAPGNGMGSDATNLQHLVHGHMADGGSLGVTKLQKKAPNVLNSHDAAMESPRCAKARRGCTRGPSSSAPNSHSVGNP